jgi:hypothetical protein
VPIEEDPRGRVCEGWLDPVVDWYMDPELWSVPLAESGPDGWERVAVDDWMATHEAPATPLEPVEITDITTGEDEITFSVDQVGVPVLVRTSYFPNWKADGAEGPYRVSPNLMVVVPTDTEVRLYYGYVPVDVAGWILTASGLGLLVVLVRRGSMVIPPGPVAEWHRPRVDDAPVDGAVDDQPLGLDPGPGGDRSPPEDPLPPEHPLPPEDTGASDDPSPPPDAGPVAGPVVADDPADGADPAVPPPPLHPTGDG